MQDETTNDCLKSAVLDHVAALRTALAAIDLKAIDRFTQMLLRARDERALIFVAGNGGSASTASHWENDLGKATKRSGRPPMRAIALTDNTAWLSALANDEGYDRVFAGQLENFAKPRVLIVISASGNSPNLIRAVDLARERQMTILGLLSFGGGELRHLVDDMVWVRSDKGSYELVEDTNPRHHQSAHRRSYGGR